MIPASNTPSGPSGVFRTHRQSLPKTRITRMHFASGEEVGWRVRFSLHCEKIVRVFTDATYGCSVAARQAAERFASEEAEHCQEILALMRRLYVRTNSRTGIPGVARVERKSGGPYWVAYWDEDGRKIQRKFSESLYGEEEAKEMAICARRLAVKPYVRRLTELKASLKIS
jgi:hypothetical protein